MEIKEDDDDVVVLLNSPFLFRDTFVNENDMTSGNALK